MANTTTDAATDRRSTVVSEEAFTIKLSYATKSQLNESGRIVAYNTFEVIHAALKHEIDDRRGSPPTSAHKVRAGIVDYGERQLLFSDAELRVSSIQIEEGSINVKAVFTLATVVSIYNGVAQYPAFKDGLLELFEDVTRATESVRELEIEEIWRLLETDKPLDQPIESFQVELLLRREEEIVEKLRRKAILKLFHGPDEDARWV